MVSVDTPEDNKRFAEQEGADFPMLSDPEKTVATAYGVLSPRGMANRWMFYIGPDGTLVKIDRVGHTADAGTVLLANLEALKVPKKK